MLGYLPAPAEAPVRFTPEIEEAVKRFHVAYRCSGPGKADWGTIGPCTKATLDRLTVDAERRYRAG